MVSLVGEQPAPNLIPARRCRPKVLLLLYTPLTLKIARRLEELLREGGAQVELLDVDPYDLLAISERLSAHIELRSWGGDQLLFNVTGGTKPMALAAQAVALELGSRIVYFQTEGGAGLLHEYVVEAGRVVEAVAPRMILQSVTLDDHLRMYLGNYRSKNPRKELERPVADVLRQERRIDEVLTNVYPANVGNLEIDFVVRVGNSVGIGEVKEKKKLKHGIDQLSTAAEPRYLGTYVRKYLVTAGSVDDNNRALAEAFHVRLIELQDFKNGKPLSERDRRVLVDAVVEVLTPRSEARFPSR